MLCGGFCGLETLSIAGSGLLLLPYLGLDVNPFTAPACNISGLKDARTHLQTVYFLVQYITHYFTFNAVRFEENPFKCQREKKPKTL